MSRDVLGGGTTFLLLTCEHGGREVPTRYSRLFRGAGSVLATHRGYDIGALGVAHRAAARLAAPILFSTVTRLLIDLNRSLDNADLFSEITRDLPEEEHQRISASYYSPYRDNVRSLVASQIAAGRRVLHVGVHSCTDVLDGIRRELDTALLFDPRRAREAALCERWREELRRLAGDLRHRFNEPYLGIDDGLTTALRAGFPPDAYSGVEFEVRQSLISRAAQQRRFGDLLADSLAAVLDRPEPR